MNSPGTGWRGWNTSDTVRPTTPSGQWIDLTWPLSADVPRLASFPAPRIERVASIPDQPLNITELSMIVHIGTHVDSPRHFFSDGPALEDVALPRLMGPGVIWRIDKPLEGMIEPEDLQRMQPQLTPGDILLIDTGIARHIGTPEYDRHVALSVAAAQWLVNKRIKMIAMDTATPDIPTHKRPTGFNWPVHHTLLQDGVLIAEQVANTHMLAGTRAEFLFLPLNIVGGDGAPARVLARPVQD